MKERCTTGFGTRRSGERIRFDLINILTESKKRINIDFDGIGVISSSFADECIGKLVKHLGFMEFSRLVTLKNGNDNTMAIINKAVSKRMTLG